MPVTGLLEALGLRVGIKAAGEIVKWSKGSEVARLVKILKEGGASVSSKDDLPRRVTRSSSSVMARG